MDKQPKARPNSYNAHYNYNVQCRIVHCTTLGEYAMTALIIIIIIYKKIDRNAYLVKIS